MNTIKLELHPLDNEPDYIGTIHHTKHGVSIGMHWNYQCKPAIRRYLCGLEQPNYPMPAIRECPWCRSKHIGHYHFIYDELIVPTTAID